MTDISQGQGGRSMGRDAVRANAFLKKRYAKNRRLQAYGIIAIVVAISMLAVLLSSIVATGTSAFRQTHVSVEVTVPADVDPADIRDTEWDDVVEAAFLAAVGDIGDLGERQVLEIISSGAPDQLRMTVEENPALIGETRTFSFPVSDRFDQLAKGKVDLDVGEERQLIDPALGALFLGLDEAGMVTQPFNWALFTEANSRYPELAGLKGALLGSLYALVVCFVLSFPIGIAAAVYLEEFAPKNRWTDLIEVNINNLAAVPSIVFGLLGLAVFIGFFGFPRSVPLVGGMVLALMTLPTIIIATRVALKAVPPSIREAALGVGASRLQVVLHHVLPLAMPGIMTGTIIGMAHALGETAPLLLIGMNAFITAAPDGMMSASTALPTQIYIWADSPERGFTARTSAAILVLLGFMILMNGLAIFLRKRLETRW